MLPGIETWFFSQLDEPQTVSLAHLPHDNGTGPLPTVLKTSQTILMTPIGGSGDTVVERYKVIGGQHVWFDIDVEGQSLEQLIWRFVSQYNTAGLIAE